MNASVWLDNFDAAKEAARKSRKPILLQFDVEGCGGCKKLYETTYADAKTAEELSEFFVLLRLDIIAHRDVRRLYGAYWTPSFYFLDYNGKSYFDCKGYFPPQEFRILLRAGFAETAVPKGRFKEALDFIERDFDELSASNLAPKIIVLKGMIEFLQTRDDEKFRELMKSIKKKYPESIEAKQYFWEK
jgi:thioredoxin-related protein